MNTYFSQNSALTIATTFRTHDKETMHKMAKDGIDHAKQTKDLDKKFVIYMMIIKHIPNNLYYDSAIKGVFSIEEHLTTQHRIELHDSIMEHARIKDETHSHSVRTLLELMPEGIIDNEQASAMLLKARAYLPEGSKEQTEVNERIELYKGETSGQEVDRFHKSLAHSPSFRTPEEADKARDYLQAYPNSFSRLIFKAAKTHKERSLNESGQNAHHANIAKKLAGILHHYGTEEYVEKEKRELGLLRNNENGGNKNRIAPLVLAL